MKIVRKKKKKALLILILAVSLVLLTVGAVLLNTFLKKDPETPKPEPPEIIEGEAIRNNSAIAYPYIDEKDITTISVVGKDNTYSLARQEFKNDDGKTTYGDFVLFYYDANGELREYRPPILDADPTVSYGDIYAIEANDSFGIIPKLSYLCSALGTPYFKERIAIPEDEDEKNEMYRRFGLDQKNGVYVYFEYIDEDGELQNRTVIIGAPMITGVGHYFRVEGRPYVYSVEINNYYDYALADFTSFIKPVITAAGLKMDGAFEPYLTTGFGQWKNVLYENTVTDKTEGFDTVAEGATVTVTAATLTPSGVEGHIDGYLKGKFIDESFDLTKTDGDDLYKYSIAALEGMPLDELDSNIFISGLDYINAKLIDADAISDGVVYEYTVTAIESVITESGEIAAIGTAVGDEKYVKVKYTVKIDGKSTSDVPQHAVINLDDGLVGDTAEEQIRAATVGELSSPIVFEVEYTEENCVKRNMLITEIITIRDKNDKTLKIAEPGSTVMYRFRYVVNGVMLDKYGTGTVVISDENEGQDAEISDALEGKKQAKELNIEISDGSYELMHAFVAYEISAIKYFTLSENIVSFRFQQASARDPYYGESLYENTMEGKYQMYALNATACESVVKMLGGIGEDSSASTGMTGLETVAIGLTPKNMYDYDLYDYTVYFELPRGITAVNNDSADSDALDDYTYYSTLGFTLYVSEVKVEKGVRYRYVGSDMYDVVAKVPADDFLFLEYGFADFYARRNLMLTNISNIANIKFDFLMEDIKGSYNNELIHQNLYTYNGAVYHKSELNESQLSQATQYDAITVSITQKGDCTETAFSKYLDAKGRNTASLYEFFDKKTDKFDQLGTAVFKELTEMIFYTYYEGYISEDDTRYSWKDGVHLMTMSVTLCDERESDKFEIYSPYDYVYEFYRVSDRRVVVRLYQQNRVTGEVVNEVSDFYLSTFAFKKIVNGYIGILNKERIDNDIPYSQ